MKPRPKSKVSQWNAGEVLQAIPRIQKILTSPPFIKFRSLSESFSPQVGFQQTMLKKVKKSKGMIFQMNLLMAFEKNRKGLKSQEDRKSFFSDQDTQLDGIQFKKISKSVKPREKYEIPVIKLEKNLPGHEEKLKIREKKETEGKKGQKRQNQVFRRRIKKNMKDEAVGNDYLLTQSSGILSQTSIVNKYLIVLPPDLNNY